MARDCPSFPAFVISGGTAKFTAVHERRGRSAREMEGLALKRIGQLFRFFEHTGTTVLLASRCFNYDVLVDFLGVKKGSKNIELLEWPLTSMNLTCDWTLWSSKAIWGQLLVSEHPNRCGDLTRWWKGALETEWRSWIVDHSTGSSLFPLGWKRCTCI